MSAARASAAAPLLLVEDDRDLREVLAESLRLEGYEVLEAVDGADAVARLRSGARPALVLLDLVMPRMDGRQVVAAMRADAALSGIPVVLVTGTPPRDLDGQVEAILRKPVGLAALCGCIERFIRPSPAERPGGAAALSRS